MRGSAWRNFSNATELACVVEPQMARQGRVHFTIVVASDRNLAVYTSKLRRLRNALR